jgi:ribosomal protein L32
MAVPKKRASKRKKNIRKTTWKRKAAKASEKAYSLAVVALKKEEEKREGAN